MKKKQIVSCVLFGAGALLIMCALYAKGQLSAIKGEIHTGSGLFPRNPVQHELSESVNRTIGRYEAFVTVGLISGVVLVISGAGLFVTSRK